MTDHVRKQIRKAAVAALMDLPTTGARVFESRVYPLAEAQLPGLLVYTTVEDSGREDSATESMRDVTLLVQGVVRISDRIEDELDDLALEVEKALDALAEGGLAKIYHGIQGTASDLAGEDVNKPHGTIALEFMYTYRTAKGAPDIAL